MPGGNRSTGTHDWVDTTAGGGAGGGTSVGTEELGGPLTDPRVGDVREDDTLASVEKPDLGSAYIGDDNGAGAGSSQTRGGSTGVIGRQS
jgi:hypothetical protein